MSFLPSAFSLNPKTPAEVNRFAPVNRFALVNPVQVNQGDAGPSRYSILTHPEGSLIFHSDIVVSTQNITGRHTALAEHILNQCGDSVANVPITVFIEISDHDRQADYYVVVHKSKTIAWIVDQAPKSFNGATQAKHEYEYWIHMENFPGPHFSTPEDLRSLKHVLGSNAIDALTSEGSTSPMSVEQIKTHLAMLDSFSGEGDVYQTYAIARLCNLIWRSRVINKYGTPTARLDRFISISDNPPAFGGTFNRLYHLKRCSRVWADRIAYTEEWRNFRATNEQEWHTLMANFKPNQPDAHLQPRTCARADRNGCVREWRQSRGSLQLLLGTRGPGAANLVQTIGSATSMEQIIGALAKRGCVDLTSSLDLTACPDYPYAAGGFGDLYQGTLLDGTRVAIKTLRIYDNSQREGKQKALKRAARELYHWLRLDHRNVLSLKGLAIFKGHISMISEWAENGDLGSYVKQNPGADRINLCKDVCEGLRYIHMNDMVHGDLKAANVVVSPSGDAMITDFGNAQLKELTLKFTKTANCSLSIRWTAPELLLEDGVPQVSMEADVYAYGMTALEVLTGKLPYEGANERRVVYLVAFEKKAPPRPDGISDGLWDLLDSCWAQVSSERPVIASVSNRLEALFPPPAPKYTRGSRWNKRQGSMFLAQSV